MPSSEGGAWRPRPVVAALVRVVLLALPVAASAGSAYLVGRSLPPGDVDTWWGMSLLLVVSVVVGVALERVARRLLPLAVLLRLSLVLPDRAPSRFRLARSAAVRPPRAELVWDGTTARPTTTADLVVELFSMLGRHDRRTRGHSERVRVLCDMLAAELRLDREARDRLQWVALLHDVGKVSVPRRVLNKPGKLDRREFDVVKQHPRTGAELARPLVPWLGEWVDGILDHHEKVDGSGYPSGKAGDEISLAGRIIAVVDAFETMTAARSYKKAMATRAAREELARCAGTHFDPVLVRAFLAVSLPRLLWATGPVSFLLQLPFLRPLAQAGQRAAAAGPEATAAVAGAAGAAVLITGGAAVVGDSAGLLDLTPRPAPAPAEAFTVAEQVPTGPRGDERLRRLTVTVPAPRQQAPVPASAPAPPPPPPPAAARPAAPPQAAQEARPAPAPRSFTRAPRRAAPAPAPAAPPPALVPGDGPVVLLGPASPTTATTATFALAVPPGAQWECQLLRNTTGGSSRWEPCAATFTVDVLRPGENTLRVRDAVTREELDGWTWTVEPG